jgi:hypothetical protein
MPMLNLLRNTKNVGILLIILVVINIALLYNRNLGMESGFDSLFP